MKEVVFHFAGLDVGEVEIEEELLAPGPHVAGDDAPDSQCHRGPSQASDIIDAELRTLLAVDPQVLSKFFAAGDLGSTLLDHPGDDHFRHTVGEIRVLLAGPQDQHRDLFAAADGALRRRRRRGGGTSRVRGGRLGGTR